MQAPVYVVVLTCDLPRMHANCRYVDDPRATDNAWMESAYFHLHLDDAKLSFRARLGMRHWQLRARRRLGKPEVGFWAFRSPKRFLALPTTDLPTDQFQWVSLDDEHNLYACTPACQLAISSACAWPMCA